MLLRDLTIENFRSFDKYQLNGLARVNLLVGDNNCGKTSVLEAACLLASEGDIAVLNHLLELREDVAFVQMPGTELARQQYGATSLVFRQKGDNSFGETNDLLRVRISANCGYTESRVAEILLLFGDTEHGVPDLSGQVVPALTVSYSEDSAVCRKHSTALGPSGLIGNMLLPRGINLRKKPSTLFVPAGGLATKQVAEIWNVLARLKRDSYATRALQLIDDSIRQILPLPDTDSRRDILIDRGDTRVSLSEFGGGAYSLLSIGCALGFTAGSILLLDEIDTGLHYSRLPEMWRMVIKTAQELDVQVFATTHSLDCLNGLQDAISSDPDLAEHVAVHRIERVIDEAVTLSGDEFALAMLRESEIR